MTIKKVVPYDLAAQDCSDYQPIQALKGRAADLEMAEDVDCDSCVHYKKEQCDVFLNKVCE